ncbi:MAG: DUF2202 domain-containing protein [Bacteroidetes bacterium]|nr:DUF2202 domain-containing protein [Bacteroidota bacterium]
MKTKKNFLTRLVLMSAIGLSSVIVSCQKDASTQSSGQNQLNTAKYSEITDPGLSAKMATFLPGVLDSSEINTLNFMREEELLARDIYLSMQNLYTLPIFKNIAKSELVHTTAIQKLIVLYNLPDPAANHQQGVFTNPDLQALYNTLLTQGSTSLNDALIVGATIEDKDIFDLQNHIAQDVDNQDILFVLNNIKNGSYNHIRAFNAQLVHRGITYVPQFITQAEFNAIIQ